MLLLFITDIVHIVRIA